MLQKGDGISYNRDKTKVRLAGPGDNVLGVVWDVISSSHVAVTLYSSHATITLDQNGFPYLFEVDLEEETPENLDRFKLLREKILHE